MDTGRIRRSSKDKHNKIANSPLIGEKDLNILHWKEFLKISKPFKLSDLSLMNLPVKISQSGS